MLKVLGILVLSASAAVAAELPSRNAKPPPAKTAHCQIDGQPGILAADGQTCIRISGYVSGQGSVGNLK